MRKALASYAFVARLLCLAVAFTSTFVIAGCGGGGTGGNTGGQTKTNPTITWAAPVAITYGTALSATQLNATASTAGTFSYTPASGTPLKAGTQTLSVTFEPADTTDYNSANASVSLVVNQATPTVNCPAPAALTYGAALSSTQLACTGSVPGSIVYTLAGNVPAMGAIPAQGTDTITVAFTPTDATDYVSVTTTMSIVVNPAVPTITGGTRYAVSDGYSLSVPEVLTCAGCAAGDVLHDATGIFADLTLPSAETTLSFNNAWEEGDYEPIFDTSEIKRAGSAYDNPWSTAFLGSASQSTAAVSTTTGTVFHMEQKTGQVYTLTTGGKTGTLFSGITGLAKTPGIIAIDDVSTDLVFAQTTGSGGIGVSDKSGTQLCYIATTGITLISGIAAKDGYVAFTAPNENKVGFASLTGCSGNTGISFTTISVAGQPWAVSMATNGAELDAYILSRDKASANGLPMLTKVNVVTGVTEGTVELTGFTPISTIRAANAYEGLYQVQAFSLSSTVAVLSMSDSTDGKVLIINTNTSGNAKMAITYTVPVPELPIGISAQESAASSTVWVAYILANSGEAVTHIGAINAALMTTNYTPGIGACQTGILAGGFVATSNGVYCSMGSTIAAPLILQP